MPDRYAVIGNPIAHSKSPLIHQAFARQTGQDILYERVLAPLEAFADTVRRLQEEGYRGANVTVPFKTEAFDLASRGLALRAREAGAVNTLVFAEGAVHGDNTDGVGLVTDIRKNLEIPIKGKRLLLIGAGGAAEGVLYPLLREQPQLLVITNRTAEKALQMATKAGQHPEFRHVAVHAQSFDALGAQAFDIVINATSAGLSDARLPLPESVFAACSLAYDMMYGKETPFMQLARAHGAFVVADGLGMLVEQAAEAFRIWRGIRPDTAPVMAALRAS